MPQFMMLLDRVESFLSRLLLLIIVALVFISALLRYVGYPINGAESIASGLFVWLIYIGADQALRKNKHLGMDFLVRRLPKKLADILDIIVLVVLLAFLVLISYIGISFTTANTGRVFEELPFLSYSLVTVAVPVGTCLMCLTIIVKLYAKIEEMHER